MNAEELFNVLTNMKSKGMDLSACEVVGLVTIHDNEGRAEEREFWPEKVEEVEGCVWLT